MDNPDNNVASDSSLDNSSQDEKNTEQFEAKGGGSFENVEEQDEKLKEIYNIIDEAFNSFKEDRDNFERINEDFSNFIKEFKEAKQNTINSDEHDKNTDKDEETIIEPVNKKDELKKGNC